MLALNSKRPGSVSVASHNRNAPRSKSKGSPADDKEHRLLKPIVSENHWSVTGKRHGDLAKVMRANVMTGYGLESVSKFRYGPQLLLNSDPNVDGP